MLNVAASGLRMIDKQRIFSKLFNQFLCNFVIGHDHELFNEFLTVDSFFTSNVNRIIFLVQFKSYLISVEDISIGPSSSFIKRYFFQNFNLFNQSVDCFNINFFRLSKLFFIIQSVVYHHLSLFIV